MGKLGFGGKPKSLDTKTSYDADDITQRTPLDKLFHNDR